MTILPRDFAHYQRHLICAGHTHNFNVGGAGTGARERVEGTVQQTVGN